MEGTYGTLGWVPVSSLGLSLLSVTVQLHQTTRKSSTLIDAHTTCIHCGVCLPLWHVPLRSSGNVVRDVGIKHRKRIFAALALLG